MKKILSILLGVLILMSFSFPVLAEMTNEGSTKTEEIVESKEFDPSVFENSALYKYDKFQRSWSIQASYIKEYSDIDVYVGVLLFDSYVEDEIGPELRIEVLNKITREYEIVDAFRALVDDNLYTYEALMKGDTDSFTFGGNVTREFLNSFKDSTEVAFQIETHEKNGTYNKYTIDTISHSDLNRLIEIADLLESSNAWNIDKSPKFSDDYVKASIS